VTIGSAHRVRRHHSLCGFRGNALAVPFEQLQDVDIPPRVDGPLTLAEPWWVGEGHAACPPAGDGSRRR
jgi:hypothetical protein